jgi:hypothetical protein
MSKSKRNTKKAKRPTTQPKEGPFTATPCNTAEESKAIGIGAVRYVYQKSIVWPTYVTHVVVRLPFQDNTIEIDFSVNGHKNSAGKTWNLTGTAAKPTLRPVLRWNNISAELTDGTLTILSKG